MTPTAQSTKENNSVHQNLKLLLIKGHYRDFPGGPMVKNPPSNAGDMGSNLGRGTKIPHGAGQLSPRATTTEPMLLN